MWGCTCTKKSPVRTWPGQILSRPGFELRAEPQPDCRASSPATPGPRPGTHVLGWGWTVSCVLGEVACGPAPLHCLCMRTQCASLPQEAGDPVLPSWCRHVEWPLLSKGLSRLVSLSW